MSSTLYCNVYILYHIYVLCIFFFFQAEDGIRDLVRSRGLGDVYKRQQQTQLFDKTSARMQEAMIAAAEILTPEQRKAMAERMGRRGMRGMGPQS